MGHERAELADGRREAVVGSGGLAKRAGVDGVVELGEVEGGVAFAGKSTAGRGG